jgi:hypothetical protein
MKKPNPSVRAGAGGGGEIQNDTISIAQRSPTDQPDNKPTLTVEFDALFKGRWPGRLRDLINVGAPKPLAVGIKAAIAAGLDAEERKRLDRLMGCWTGTICYLRALSKSGAQRHDLDGNPVEAVTPEHSAHALQRLRRARQRRARRDAEAEREQERRANSGLPVLRLKHGAVP